MTPEPTNPNNADLEILGQKLYFPNSIYKLTAFALLLLSAVACVYIFTAHHYTLTRAEDGSFSFSEIREDNVTTTKGYTIGFWTPSDKTRIYLDSAHIEEDELRRYQWQLKPARGKNFELANQEFGEELQQQFKFNGYRRYEVLGKGQSGHSKAGWWWMISFEGKCDEAFLKEFKEAYTSYWLPDDKGKDWDKLYVEVLGSSSK